MKKIAIIILICILAFHSQGIVCLAEVNDVHEKTSQGIIVALDPGHDKKHAGATYGDLLEHILTLKIANYCKEELEKHNIQVYMTREDEPCLYPDVVNSGKCIEQRVIAAKKAGAQMYVSIHINAEQNGSKANGVEVIYPNDSWKEDHGKQGGLLAQSIQNELVQLGLADRGIYTRNTTIGETYEDGSVGDYYSVQIYGKENDLPGIIVEHGFITNEADRERFLTTEEGLKALGLADARGILSYLALSEGEEPEEPVEPEQPEEPELPDTPFNDIHEDKWYYDYVMWAYENDVAHGVKEADGTYAFQPERSCTRAEFVKFLWNLVGTQSSEEAVNSFTDISKDKWYYESVLWAVENEVTHGVKEADGTYTFRPQDVCSRAHAAQFIYNYFGGKEVVEGMENPFTDISEDAWYYNAVLWGYKEGVISGIKQPDGTFRYAPEENVTRAQVVKLIKCAYDK